MEGLFIKLFILLLKEIKTKEGGYKPAFPLPGHWKIAMVRAHLLTPLITPMKLSRLTYWVMILEKLATV